MPSHRAEHVLPYEFLHTNIHVVLAFTHARLAYVLCVAGSRFPLAYHLWVVRLATMRGTRVLPYEFLHTIFTSSWPFSLARLAYVHVFLPTNSCIQIFVSFRPFFFATRFSAYHLQVACFAIVHHMQFSLINSRTQTLMLFRPSTTRISSPCATSCVPFLACRANVPSYPTINTLLTDPQTTPNVHPPTCVVQQGHTAEKLDRTSTQSGQSRHDQVTTPD